MSIPRIPAFYFDRDLLLATAGRLASSYTGAAPFPHVVIDDFLPSDIADLLAAEFPGPDRISWVSRDFDTTTQTRKLGCSDETQFGPFTRHFMTQMLSHTFVAFLEALTGVRGLITDPSHNECGLHSTGAGGKLAVHTDLNRHPIRGRLHQHLNVLLYLNGDWPEEYGGHLELWERDLSQPARRILPVSNRLVVFETGAHSFHGHPQPLACPTDRRRNSLALYYYTLDRPAGSRYAGLQEDVNWVPTQPDEKRLVLRRKLRRLADYVLPPALMDLLRWLKARVRRGPET